jgi:hypothetical protein
VWPSAARVSAFATRDATVSLTSLRGAHTLAWSFMRHLVFAAFRLPGRGVF